MCRLMQCARCERLTWAGCGKHLEQLFHNIAYDKRCWCFYDKVEMENIKQTILANQARKSAGPFPRHRAVSNSE